MEEMLGARYVGGMLIFHAFSGSITLPAPRCVPAGKLPGPCRSAVFMEVPLRSREGDVTHSLVPFFSL